MLLCFWFSSLYSYSLHITQLVGPREFNNVIIIVDRLHRAGNELNTLTTCWRLHFFSVILFSFDLNNIVSLILICTPFRLEWQLKRIFRREILEYRDSIINYVFSSCWCRPRLILVIYLLFSLVDIIGIFAESVSIVDLSIKQWHSLPIISIRVLVFYN